tara:strand:- start:943 stop:1428 length:486 start_codon:yes stop_codon:yes gene_type:complete
MIKIFVTEGTFDKDYDEKNGKLYFKKTHMNEILALGRSKVEVCVETLMMLDSLDMKEKHRELIVEKCTDALIEQIVITHGTDTMVNTVRILGAKHLKKTTVKTGAMIPYKFSTSDGLFNIVSALAYVQAMPHGLYIAMNGRVFLHDKVIKNRGTGIFDKIK